MFCFENGAGFKPAPIVCVRDTKVRKYLVFGPLSYNCWEVVLSVEKVLQFCLNKL